MEKLISSPKVAEMIGVRPQTLRSWISAGAVEYSRIGSRNFFSPEQIDKIIKIVPVGMKPSDRENR